MSDWQTYEPDLDRITVERFSLAERLQHIVLMVSMVVLMLTGLPLLVPKVGTHLVGGAFSVRTFLHHFAGVVMIGLALFHVGWVLFTERGRSQFGHILPRVQDLRDLLHFVRYNLGRVDEPPAYDRFDPFEKFEYFAVVWGSAVMVVTGLMMWFIEVTLRLVPLWVYNIVLFIHGYEAIVAFLAIILGHLYNVHLKPGVFPMSRVWLDGKMTLRKLKTHHPKEYERWLREQRQHEPSLPAPAQLPESNGEAIS